MVWLLGVVVRRYIDFLILLIPTPLVSVLFYISIPTFCSFFYIDRVAIDFDFRKGLALLAINRGFCTQLVWGSLRITPNILETVQCWASER